MKKNKHYYLRNADDAILDAIFDLLCVQVLDTKSNGDNDCSITTLIKALNYSRETIKKIGAQTYEKNN